MKMLLMLFVAIFLILQSGCGDRKIGHENANPKPETKLFKIIVVGIDESGSYTLWNPVKKAIMNLIRGSPRIRNANGRTRRKTTPTNL